MAGIFRWDNGKFPDFTEPDPAYDGIKYWDAFGNFPGLGNVAYVFNTRVKLLRDTELPLTVPCLAIHPRPRDIATSDQKTF